MGLAINSDNRILAGPVEIADGSAVTSSTVTAAILDSNRNALANSSISLTEIGSSNVFQGTFPKTVDLTTQSSYIVQVTVIANSYQRVIENTETASRS